MFLRNAMISTKYWRERLHFLYRPDSSGTQDLGFSIGRTHAGMISMPAPPPPTAAAGILRSKVASFPPWRTARASR